MYTVVISGAISLSKQSNISTSPTLRGYVRGAGDSSDVSTQLNTKALAALEAKTLMETDGPAKGGGGWDSKDVQLNNQQMLQVQQGMPS